MISNILIKLILWYQSKDFFPHKACCYTPTCSEYMKLAIEKYGAKKGFIMGIKRIFRCTPKHCGEIDYP